MIHTSVIAGPEHARVCIAGVVALKELPSPTQPLLDLLHRRSITSSRPLRPALQTAPASISAPALEVVWARHQDEVRAAQRLRYSVFAVEHGARLQPPSGTPDAHDADRRLLVLERLR